MEIWYFETSAVNEFMKRFSLETAMATKQLQLNKGREWRLSPVALWEILMTSDENRRDKIVYFCQHLFNRELLPSPAELIIAFIEQGMPEVEKYRKLLSKTAIANIWRDLVDDKNKCFIIDYNELRSRVKLVQDHTKDIHQIVKNGDLIISSEKSFLGLDLSLSSLIEELPFIKTRQFVVQEERLAYKVSLYYITLILCAEGELENEIIQKFWQKVGLNSTLDRILYVLQELPALVYRGPFYMMSCMTIAQTKGKYARGVWFDSLHSIYITYADQIFTSDRHFLKLRESIDEPMLWMKIHHVDELEITYH